MALGHLAVMSPHVCIPLQVSQLVLGCWTAWPPPAQVLCSRGGHCPPEVLAELWPLLWGGAGCSMKSLLQGVQNERCSHMPFSRQHSLRSALGQWVLGRMRPFCFPCR